MVEITEFGEGCLLALVCENVAAVRSEAEEHAAYGNEERQWALVGVFPDDEKRDPSKGSPEIGRKVM